MPVAGYDRVEACEPAPGKPVVSGRDHVLELGLALWGAACLLGGVSMARPLLNAESDLTWVLDVCGASLRSRIGLVASIGAVSGAVFGLALVATAPHSSVGVALPLHLAPTGAALAAVALASIRITTRGTGRDSGRQLRGEAPAHP